MMILNSVKFALALGVSASFMTMATPQVANSQSFLEKLFNKRAVRLPHNQQQQQVAPAVSKPVKIKKVAHEYYNFRAPALKKVKFATLIKLADKNPSPQTAQSDDFVVGAVQNGDGNRDFLEAVSELKGVNISARKDIGKAVVDFYLSNPEFYWVNDGAPSPAAMGVSQLIEKAGEVGLVPGDYQVNLPANGADKLALIQFELKMSIMAVRYALDARIGKINPNKLGEYHFFPKAKYTAAQAVAELLTSNQPTDYLDDASPDSEKFQILKATLAELQNESADTITIADGTLIKPGKIHDQLPNVIAAIRKKASTQLLQRYGETLTAYSRTQLFDDNLVALVKAFQKEKKLTPDGIIGRNTIAKLVDASPKVKMNRVRLAMERLRWLPREFGNRYVFINQPDFRARYIEADQEVLSMRAIVGKPSNQTPFFYDTIERVVFNPYWGVPRSIITNVMLPKLRKNAAYLDQGGYELTNSAGKRISSASVNWMNVGGGRVPFSVRQPPGKKNALGTLKILFPNKDAIYMHDTPQRNLFNKDRRAFSYGCIRLQQPQEMAAAVLGTTVSKVYSRIDTGKNNKLELQERIPVYVAYFTAWPNWDGEVEFFADMYGRDKYLNRALEKVAVSRARVS
ncbi:MAG: L,D-transpeptidase family protein [Rhizobiaceae bacterium]|nr:L,D-transpeptidase family protein [Rhizobiaceae bacterium]